MAARDDLELIREQVEVAHSLAERGSHDAAALAFALARRLGVSIGDSDAVAQRLANHTRTLEREREHYRKMLSKRRSGERRLVILADSLGLPRPDAKRGSDDGVGATYPAMLLDRLPSHGVESYCQRYFTTDSIVELLETSPDVGVDADVVLHVGLNDCANRMFVERERIAIDLLPDETKERLVGFAQKYRRQIIEHLPAYHYVPPERFRSNIQEIFRLLRQRRCRTVTVATIILPPIRFWPGTPGVQANFGRYNQLLMDGAAQHGGRLFDVDRHVWAGQHEGVLLDDGMHLSESGHALFADQVASMVA